MIKTTPRTTASKLNSMIKFAWVRMVILSKPNVNFSMNCKQFSIKKETIA